MSTQLAQRLRDQQIEALKIQQQYLTVARDRHQTWSKNSDDLESKRIRSEIIDLMQKTLVQYDRLLEVLCRPMEGD
jgi:hypothetical protein